MGKLSRVQARYRPENGTIHIQFQEEGQSGYGTRDLSISDVAKPVDQASNQEGAASLAGTGRKYVTCEIVDSHTAKLPNGVMVKLERAAPLPTSPKVTVNPVI